MTHIKNLVNILSSSYILYIKIQNFHWNVEGRGFFAIHSKLEGLYEAFAESNDELAERLLMLGQKAPGSAAEFLKHSFIKESGNDKSAEDMISELLADFSLFRDKCKECIALADEVQDTGTVDLLSDIVSALEKEIWMLSSYLK